MCAIVGERQARRRFVLALAGTPATGDTVRLVVATGTLEDDFLNRNSVPHLTQWTWTGLDEVPFDDRAPWLAEVRIRAGRVEIEWSEEVDSQSANTAVAIDGAATGWKLLEDRYTLRSVLSVSPLTHTIEIAAGVEDASGRGSEQSWSLAVPAGSADRLAYRAPDSTEVPISTLANRFGFHGAAMDDESGLVYFRNRYYDPELGRFLTDDPNLYADSGNPGQFALNNPFDLRDPMGEAVLGWASARNTNGKGQAGRAEFALHNAVGTPTDWSFVQQAGDRLVTYVHGYNVNQRNFTHGWLPGFNEGFERVGRSQSIYGFTWKGDPLGEGWSTPFFGTAEANADVAGIALAKYLGGARAAGGSGMDLFVVSHSLGARVALRGLQHIAAWRKPLQGTEFGQTHYSQDIDGLFTLNGAVTRRSLTPGGFLESALDVVSFYGNFHSREDPVLGGVFKFRKAGNSAVGSGPVRERLDSNYAGRVKDFDMMDPDIAGSPACTHSNHLLPSRWPYLLSGPHSRDPSCYGAGVQHGRLFETLANEFDDRGRGSRR